MRQRKAIVVGAGIGGLAAAVTLAAEGVAVTVLDALGAPGGKLRQIAPDGGESGLAPMDVGPTVFTMRDVFDGIVARAGYRLDDLIEVAPLAVLARHAWADGPTLDLHADIATSAEAIAAFAGPREAAAYRAFVAEAQAIYHALEQPYIRASRPGPLTLLARGGPSGLGALWRTRPFTTLWNALGQRFADPRLRQLFARYATYCGSSPFLAPATLMLVAHVEQAGVWRIKGGMHALARALERVASGAGAIFHYGTPVARILAENGRACGVVTEAGERIEADSIIFNGDVAALGAGLLGAQVHRAAPRVEPRDRSLSAVTLAMVARAEGFPLAHHNVFFSQDYPAEFDAILTQRRLPPDPTVYVCAPDDLVGERAPQRLFMIINAAADGDRRRFSDEEITQCETATIRRLARSGLKLSPQAIRRAQPADFASLFPATGGALYGRASHGWMASFRRMGSRSRIPGLYLAGGSVHPGPGVPMAATSGRLAAEAVIQDWASQNRSRPAAIAGGMSMPSATTAPKLSR